MKVLKKFLNVVISMILWLIILLAALYAFTTLATHDQSSVANIAGYTPMIVQTDSMSPTFDAGDLILIRTCDPATLQEGDIITFHTIINNEYALNTHRIQEITETEGVRSYVTKGDNNEISDQHIIADGDIVGIYIGRLPKMGKVMDILSSSTGFLIIIVLPMLLFFIYQVYHLIMVSINLKKAMAVEDAAEQARQQAEAEAAAHARWRAEEDERRRQEEERRNAKCQEEKSGNAEHPEERGTEKSNGQPDEKASENPKTMSDNAAAECVNDEKASGEAETSSDTSENPDGGKMQETADDDTAAILAEAKRLKAEAERIKAQAEAEKARAEAEIALAEAKRLKAEAEAQLAQMEGKKEEEGK